MTDPLLTRSAIDRLQSAVHKLVLDGESYRRRQKPGLDTGTINPRATPQTPSDLTPTTPAAILTHVVPDGRVWPHATGEPVAASRWRATPCPCDLTAH
jgi:hypothetical protein